MLLAASQSVAVEDYVTISTIEVSIGGRIHCNPVAVLNTPDLEARRHSDWPQLSPSPPPTPPAVKANLKDDQ